MSNQDRKQFPKSGGKPQPVPSAKGRPQAKQGRNPVLAGRKAASKKSS